MGNVALSLPTPGNSNGLWGAALNAALNAVHGDYLSQTDGLSKAAAGWFTGDNTGSSDIGSALQAAFDTGWRAILPAGTFLLETPVFLDSADSDGMQSAYVIEGNGKTILKLGAGLPTVDSFSDNTTTWAFHLNTLRTALSGGVVTHSDATRASGSGYPARPRLIVRDMVIDGGSLNAGLVYGNTAAVLFERCVFRNLKFAGSWRGYSDGWTARDYQIVSQVSGGALLKQEAAGDGFALVDGKGSAVHYSGQQALSGRIVNVIGGSYRFTQCRGIEVQSCHTELDEPATAGAFLWSDRSQVQVRGCYWQVSKGAGTYAVEIADNAADPESASDLLLDGCLSALLLNVSDPARDPDIRITGLNGGGRVRGRGITAYTYASGSTPGRVGGGPYITSADAGITTALGNARHLIAADAWELAAYDGTWEIVNPSALSGVRVNRRATVPTITADTTVTATGTLTATSSYEYQAATQDGDGLFSAGSTTVTAAAPASGSIGIVLSGQAAPVTLRLWRSAAGTVTTAPDFYCDIPLATTATELVDTGAHVNGFPWVTAGAQTPQNNAAVNHTFEHLTWRINGVLWGQGAGSPEGVVTAPVGSMWSRSDGGAGTSLYVKESGSGNTGWVAK